jgi:hypothetical protein
VFCARMGRIAKVGEGEGITRFLKCRTGYRSRCMELL